jgi:hypothetical protein
VTAAISTSDRGRSTRSPHNIAAGSFTAGALVGDLTRADPLPRPGPLDITVRIVAVGERGVLELHADDVSVRCKTG